MTVEEVIRELSQYNKTLPVISITTDNEKGVKRIVPAIYDQETGNAILYETLEGLEYLEKTIKNERYFGTYESVLALIS